MKIVIFEHTKTECAVLCLLFALRKNKEDLKTRYKIFSKYKFKYFAISMPKDIISMHTTLKWWPLKQRMFFMGPTVYVQSNNIDFFFYYYSLKRSEIINLLITFYEYEYGV